jgi:hypothetical protein
MVSVKILAGVGTVTTSLTTKTVWLGHLAGFA